MLAFDWFIAKANWMPLFRTPSLWLAGERSDWFVAKANFMPPESHFSFRFLLQAYALLVFIVVDVSNLLLKNSNKKMIIKTQ